MISLDAILKDAGIFSTFQTELSDNGMSDEEILNIQSYIAASILNQLVAKGVSIKNDTDLLINQDK